MVTCKAGSAAIINQSVFHANFPNVSREDRHLLAIAYRPAWAGPVEDKIPAWEADKVAGLPAHLQRFFSDRNVRRGFDFNHKNKPDNMTADAPGISPSRWERSE